MPKIKKERATTDDLLNLIAAKLNDPKCRSIMAEIAASEGGRYIKWRAPEPDEALVLSEFRENWFIENDFAWPPTIQVSQKLGFAFPILIWILRGEYAGVDDPRLAEYLSSQVFKEVES